MKIPKNFLLKQIEVGPMQNYVYLIGDGHSREVAVVDPAWDIPLIRHEADEDQLRIVAIFLTHGHYDHCDGTNDLLAFYDVPVYLSEKEAEFYTPDCRNLHRTKDHQKIQIGSVDIECLHTPGHTPGCQCFYVPGHLLTGDTLFIGGCGRCDLPGGDPKALHASLQNVIGKLPSDTIIYPGHSYGSKTSDTLASQKKTNPYLNCSKQESFLTKRTGF